MLRAVLRARQSRCARLQSVWPTQLLLVSVGKVQHGLSAPIAVASRLSPPVSLHVRHHAATPVHLPKVDSSIPHKPPRPPSTSPSSPPTSSAKAAPAPASKSGSSKRAQPKYEEIPRNEVGVQLLPRRLHQQLFPSTMDPVPPIESQALSICRDHLSQHGLKASDAATLPQTAFDMPQLQGKDLAEHFWTIGREVAQPWLGMAYHFASAKLIDPPEEREEGSIRAQEDDFRVESKEWLELNPELRVPAHLKPVTWSEEPGWTRYPVLRSKDGTAAALGVGESVPYPDKEDDTLVFDVETMVQEGPFSVMATAVGQNAWYSWLSPWLLQRGEGHERKDHLIPLGPSDPSARARLVIGHNVSYDRARTLEEYTLDLGSTRWLDTMALHVATRGISSPQRPAWIKHNKAKAEKRAKKLLDQAELKEETRRAIQNALSGLEYDVDQLEGLKLEALALDQLDVPVVSSSSSSTSQGGAGERESDGAASASPAMDMEMPFTDDEGGGLAASAAAVGSNPASKWLDETSKNSLADVARLHRIPMKVSKSARDVFVDGVSREEIRADVQHLLTYCASDVAVTHEIFRKTWPDFAARCPHPATMGGVFGLGSTFLPVDDEWLDYQRRCDEQFNSINDQVQKCLIDLAEKLKVEGTQDVPWSLAAAIAEERALATDEERSEPVFPDPERKRAWWEDDAWYSQLDWTPKKPKRSKVLPEGLSSSSSSAGSELSVPAWYKDNVIRNKSKAGFGPKSAVAQQLLRLRIDGKAVVRAAATRGWQLEDGTVLSGSNLLSAAALKRYGSKMTSDAGEAGTAILDAVTGQKPLDDRELMQLTRSIADNVKAMPSSDIELHVQLNQLDWTEKDIRVDELMALRNGNVVGETEEDTTEGSQDARTSAPSYEPEWWPKWYWDLYKSATGELQVTIRSAIAPILLKISWRGCPLYRSREHGWVFRHDPKPESDLVTRQTPLSFGLAADGLLQHLAAPVNGKPSRASGSKNNKTKSGASVDKANKIEVRAFGHSIFYKVPHSEGEGANVGSPFAKSFIAYFEDGTLQSQHPDEIGRTAAKTALELNAQCSYWIAVRDRVNKQMVVWDGQATTSMQYPSGASGARQDRPGEADRRKGLILPQVVSMGTVTRRAIENTWLTASNAKKNRVGSELKAMVKAPPGYSLVGADVDSEELWICSVMGDAQFGVHGATAVGWMTLEGTKALGTDLHSKTASILGTSRNQAKVFNYSRIYGAGIKHATHLLLKANPSVSNDEATRLAKELYMATKGQNTHTDELFGRKFWFGGTESYVFNKLESIALSDDPKTPALDCGVTNALTKKFLGKVDFGNGRLSEEYMPSRINWVVQSSGVDYLHLLITAMEWLTRRYEIDARFMLSVHDEVRYLVKDDDRYRAALALQVANIWTRAMFAFKLQMDDLPLGCAFFAQVDIDKVLRKEADDPCVTPSHPDPIPVGVALDIEQILQHTGGSLAKSEFTRSNMSATPDLSCFHDPGFPEYVPSTQVHRSLGQRGLYYLQAQASKEIAEIRALEARARMAEQGTTGEAKVTRIPRKRAAAPSALPVGSRRASNNSSSSRNSTSTSRSSSSTPATPTGTRPRPRPPVRATFDEDAWVQSCAEDAAQQKPTRTTRRSSSSGTSSNSLRAGGGSKRPTTSADTAAASSTHVVSSRSEFSTSAGVWQARSPASQTIESAAVAEAVPLGQFFPRRKLKKHRPFFREPEHRHRVLWTVYRPLLRACGTDYPNIRSTVRQVMRKRKALVSQSAVEAQIVRAQELLSTLLRAREGDTEAQDWVTAREASLKARENRRVWNELWAAKVHEAKYPERISHHSGALLPPTIYNPPLPRYKPVQPVKISMMIFRRRIARMRRSERLSEIRELLSALENEQQLMSRAVDSLKVRRSLKEAPEGNWASGFEHELLSQTKSLEASFTLDHKRSHMVFDPKILVMAKRARRGKLRARLARKHAATQAARELAETGSTSIDIDKTRINKRGRRTSRARGGHGLIRSLIDL
ncbi:hypothetical protein BCV70DRAFT_167566 [Testicularia cyperi]|uniref:Mitochondrial DNA polymerase catalytic subunit n=1 Tax=Testicularia cyperi TaxID=1882483 RepID=A0A317XFG0_9BASI|nr:hypothetical protein BCV70DRAFT_167566 [Testicularia cyperi]